MVTLVTLVTRRHVALNPTRGRYTATNTAAHTGSHRRPVGAVASVFRVSCVRRDEEGHRLVDQKPAPAPPPLPLPLRPPPYSTPPPSLPPPAPPLPPPAPAPGQRY